MHYLDLTHTITNNMPAHPLDIAIQLQSTATYQEHGVANESLHGGVHMGTHIDAPGHFIDNGKKITDFPLSTFIGRAVCIDAHKQKIITPDLLMHIQLKKDDIIIFYTGWDIRFYESNYFDEHPVISKDCAQYLINAGIKMVGVDFPSVDTAPYAIHRLLLSHDILIIENLTNIISLINKPFNLIALPLKIDAHGAPARVIAEIK
jgi:kynurenine formamidase